MIRPFLFLLALFLLSSPLQAAERTRPAESQQVDRTSIDGEKKKKLDLDTEKQWWEALKEGDTDKIKEILTGFAVDINQEDQDGATPLDIAAKNGHAAIVECLIKELIKCPSFERNNTDRTLLQYALKYKVDIALIKDLMQKNVNLLINGKSLLQLALNPSSEERRINVLAVVGWSRALTNRTIPAVLYEVILTYCNYHPRWMLDATQALLRKGACLNEYYENGWTPLHCAAKNGHIATCKYFIAHGADHNKATKNGWTPLLIAAAHGYKTMCQYLVEACKADTGKGDIIGCTPLHIAAAHGHTATCHYFIESVKMDPNQVTSNGWSPLHLAAKSGHTDTCTYLVNFNKVDLNKGVEKGLEKGCTPLHIAAQQDHTYMCEFLVACPKVDCNKADDKGWTPLYIAALYGRTEICKILLNANADANKADKQGWSPLCVAAQYGHQAICQLLVAADLNKPGKNGSLLHQAARNGHKETCQLLVKYKSDVNAKNHRGETPLYIAAAHGHTSTCQYLIEEAKADAYEADKNGWTPLHIAARNGHTATCQYLVEGAGVDPNKGDKEGYTAQFIARQKGHTATSHYLETKGGKLSSRWDPIYIAARNAAHHKDRVKFRYLIERTKADINQKDKKGWTFLHTAAWDNDIRTLEFLLEEGANPYVRTTFLLGQTPRDIAKEKGHKGIVALLQKKAHPMSCTRFLTKSAPILMLAISVALALYTVVPQA